METTYKNMLLEGKEKKETKMNKVTSNRVLNSSKSAYQALDTSFIQNNSSTLVVYIVTFLAIGLGIIYLVNYYRSIKAVVQSTAANVYPDCPDYWESIGKGRCRNTNFLGACANVAGANVVDFGGEIFTNANTGAYAKCKWAQACSTAWSGVDRLC